MFGFKDTKFQQKNLIKINKGVKNCGQPGGQPQPQPTQAPQPQPTQAPQPQPTQAPSTSAPLTSKTVIIFY